MPVKLGPVKKNKKEWSSLVAQMVKNLPAMQETGTQSLGGEDPLEKRMTTYSSIFAWRIPWTEEPGYKEQLTLSFHFSKKEWKRFL